TKKRIGHPKAQSHAQFAHLHISRWIDLSQVDDSGPCQRVGDNAFHPIVFTSNIKPQTSILPSYFLIFTSAVNCGVKPSLTGIILEELADFLEKRGAASYRAKQITDWIYKKRIASFDAMTDLPNELRAELATE